MKIEPFDDLGLCCQIVEEPERRVVEEPERRVMEYGSFGREKHPLETYLDAIETSISDIRYLISRIPYPSEEPKNVFKRIQERFKRIHDQSREGNKWIRWCRKTKEEERS